MNDLLGYRTIFGQDTTIWKSGGYIEKIYFSNEYYNQKWSFDIVMVGN